MLSEHAQHAVWPATAAVNDFGNKETIWYSEWNIACHPLFCTGVSRVDYPLMDSFLVRLASRCRIDCISLLEAEANMCTELDVHLCVHSVCIRLKPLPTEFLHLANGG